MSLFALSKSETSLVFKCETSFSLLLFIFVYNKLVIVIAGFTLFLLRKALCRKVYI